MASGRTRLAVYRTNPSPINDQLAENLSRFDLIAVDFDAYAARPEGVARIKQLNPRVKIFIYLNPMELFEPGSRRNRSNVYAARPLQHRLYQFISQERSQWFLQTTDGQPIIYWTSPEMRKLNFSTLCPEVEGERWCEFVARWHLEHTLNDPNIDGVLLDNTWDNVSWVPEYLSRRDGRIVRYDLNCDGQPESNQELDQRWADGVRCPLQIIREAKGPDFLIIGNKPNLDFAFTDDGSSLCNGKMSENFPDPCFQRDWLINMYHFRQQIRMGMEYSILSSHDLTRQGTDQSRRFGLTSALMFGGFYSFRQDSARWYPEYDQLAALGDPVGPCQMPFEPVFVEYFESRQRQAPFSNSDRLERVHGEAWYRLEGAERISLPRLEPGRYLVTFRFRATNLEATHPMLLVQGDSGWSRTVVDWTRWSNSVCHELVELSQPGELVISAVGAGAAVLINDVEIWRDTRSQSPLWSRQFQHGWAICNPSDASQTTRLGGQEVTLPSRDGAIILKRR